MSARYGELNRNADDTVIVFTLLLPEVKGRDPDLILAQEIRERRGEMERKAKANK